MSRLVEFNLFMGRTLKQYVIHQKYTVSLGNSFHPDIIIPTQVLKLYPSFCVTLLVLLFFFFLLCLLLVLLDPEPGHDIGVLLPLGDPPD